MVASDDYDPDNPPLPDDFFAKATPRIGGKPVTKREWRARMDRHLRDNPEIARRIAAENPDAARAIAKRLGGRPALETPKKSVTIRLDADIVEHFRATGEGWQTRINAVLRKAAKLPALPVKAARAGATVAKRSPKKTRRA